MINAIIIENSITIEDSIPSVNHLTPNGEEKPIRKIDNIKEFTFFVLNKNMEIKE